jgi:hypothetical protein
MQGLLVHHLLCYKSTNKGAQCIFQLLEADDQKYPLRCRNLGSFKLYLSRAIPSPLSIDINHSVWTGELFAILAPFAHCIKDLGFSSNRGSYEYQCPALWPWDLTMLQRLAFFDPLGECETALAQILDSIHSSVQGALSLDLYLSSKGSISALHHPALCKSHQLFLGSGITSSR